MVVPGETEITFVAAPLLQEYVPPPLALSVALCPAQIALLVAVTLAVGDMFTFTNALAVSEQVALETITE